MTSADLQNDLRARTTRHAAASLHQAWAALVTLLVALCAFGCSSAGQDNADSLASQEPLTTPVYQINCGGPAVSPFAADQYATGGTPFSASATVTTSGVSNAAPAAVYQSERYGNETYTFPSLTVNGSYTVRLHFAEIYFTAAGQRVFNVLVNGTQVLTNFDIFAAAGANKALVLDFAATANASGKIAVQLVSVTDNAKVSGIEILSSSTPRANQAPTVATAASASPNPVTSTTANLSVLGADDGGEAQLTYTWATSGTPPAAVTFSANGTNAAKNTVATFSANGSYTLVATIKDASGATATSSVAVTVNVQKTDQLTATAYHINSGGSATGTFAADQYYSGGTGYSSSNVVSTAGVTNAAPAAVYQSERYGTHSYAFPSLTAGASYTVRLHFAEIYFTSAGQRTFNVLVNGTQVLTNFDIYANAGANKALVRDFTATASSSGVVNVQLVNVVENAKVSGIEILAGSGAQPPPTQTLTSISVTPKTAALTVGGKQQFSATALDQNGSAMSSQPTFTWTASGGGTITSAGLYTSSAAGTFTISATGGGKTGTASVTNSAAGGGPGANDVVANTSDVHQRIDGFGASDKYATLTDAQADLFFTTTSGIGLSIMRVAISPNGTDISPIANAQKAAARGAIVWGSPWSPPADWKDNGSTGNGGHLLAADYDAWASRLAGFATTMQQNGVPLYGISVQNEPDYTATWDSCLYTSAQMVSFIKVLGPKLAAMSPRPKLLSPESSYWGALWGYGDAILADSTASAYTDIIATHDYAYATTTHAAISKPIWETEVSSFDGPSTDITNGITVAKWIHRALVTGSVSAWHYWWLVGQSSDNEGLLNPGNVVTKRLYTLGNYSKFVRPGYSRVGVTGPVPAGVSVSAYVNPANGTVVIVAINENTTATSLSAYAAGSHASATPWVTSASDSLAAKTAISISGGRFTSSLAAQSVTTFVIP